jgi:hypothetical protein
LFQTTYVEINAKLIKFQNILRFINESAFLVFHWFSQSLSQSEAYKAFTTENQLNEENMWRNGM